MNEELVKAIRAEGTPALHRWQMANPISHLANSYLRAADLSGADLMDANLRAADLQRANLGGANLGGANLHGADLGGANLQRAKLFGTYLVGTDLSRADLGGADLRGANLANAVFSGARFDKRTRWPEGFDPVAQGAVQIESEPEPEPEPETVDVRRSIRDIIATLSVVEHLDDESLAALSAAVEKLRSEIQHHLQQGTWSHENGAEPGLEEDIAGDLRELDRLLRPLSGRPVNSMLVQVYVSNLAGYLLDIAQGESTGENSVQIAELHTGVVDRLARADGSEADTDSAIDAMDALAHLVDWAALAPPDESDIEAWTKDSQRSEHDNLELIARIVKWLPDNAITSAQRGAIAGLGVGVQSQFVAAWLGSATTSAAGVGTVGGMVGAVIGAIIGVMAARFKN